MVWEGNVSRLYGVGMVACNTISTFISFPQDFLSLTLDLYLTLTLMKLHDTHSYGIFGLLSI